MAERRGRPVRRLVMAGLVMGMLVGAAGPASAVAVGPLQDLGTLGGLTSGASDVNDLGQVVGTSWAPGSYPNEAFVTDPDGTMHGIGSLCLPTSSPSCFPSSSGNAINDAGQVTGASTGPFDSEHAYRYDPGSGAMEDLGTLGGARSVGYAIADDGVVVGMSYSPVVEPNGRPRAFVAVPGEPMVDLGSLPAAVPTAAQANGINAHGMVVGSSNYGANPNLWHPVTWDLATGEITDLGALGNENAYGAAISDTGFITGLVSVPGASVPFLIDPATDEMRALPLPPGMDFASGADVNDDGVVLISATRVPSPGVYERHSFVYDSRTEELAEILPIAGPDITPSAISDSGFVVGATTVAGVQPYYSRAFRGQFQVAPGAPTGLVVTGCGSTAALSWSAPAFTGYADELTYEVRRDGETIGTVDGTAFTDLAAPPATATYEVLATNAGGSSAPATVTWPATPCPPGTTVPTTPTSSTGPTTSTTAPPAARPADAVATRPRFTG